VPLSGNCSIAILSTKALYNEPHLIILASQGNREAFTSLYSHYLDAVTQYIRLFTNSEDEADEVIQDVFVRIWEQRDKLSTVTSFRSYVARAARNRLLDHLRHLEVRKAAILDLQQTKTTAETPEDIWHYRYIYAKVQQQIAALPTQCQHVFRLSVEKGMSLDEIAAELHISKSGVKNQLYKAQKLVRQCFEEKDSHLFIVFLLSIPTFSIF